MYEVLYFTHLTGLVLWLGAAVMSAWWVMAAVGAGSAEARAWGLSMARRLSNWVIAPGGPVVMVAGISMVMVSGTMGASRPLWFQVMESGGGMVALVSAVAIPLLGRRVWRAAADQAALAHLRSATRLYAGALAALAVCVCGVLLTVSLRIS